MRLGQGGAQALGMGEEGSLDDDGAGRGVGKDASVLGRREAPVERQQDGADPGAGEQQDQLPRMIEAEERHDLAPPHAERRQPPDGEADVRGQRGVAGLLAGE